MTLTCHLCTRALRCSLSLHDHTQAAFNYLWSNNLSCRYLCRRKRHRQPGGTRTPGSAGAATRSRGKLKFRGWIRFLLQSSKPELINFAGPAAGFRYGQFMHLRAVPLGRGRHHRAELARAFSPSFKLGLNWGAPALCSEREGDTEPAAARPGLVATSPRLLGGLKFRCNPVGLSSHRRRGSAQSVLKIFLAPEWSCC